MTTPAPAPANEPAPGGGKLLGGVAALLALSTGFAVLNEDVVLEAYADPVWGWQVPTICAGDTEGVKRGDTATLEECMARLGARHLHTWRRLERECLTAPVTVHVAASLVSLADNAGHSAVCQSTLVRLHNAGHRPERYCLQFTQAQASYIPFGILVKLDKNGKLLNTEDVVRAPIGWVRANWRNCRDRRNKCYGLVTRREREQAMCLGDIAKAMGEGAIADLRQ